MFLRFWLKNGTIIALNNVKYEISRVLCLNLLLYSGLAEYFFKKYYFPIGLIWSQERLYFPALLVSSDTPGYEC